MNVIQCLACISFILCLSFGITTVCEYEMCGWNKEICTMSDVEMKVTKDSMYELHAKYSAIDYWYCTKNRLIVSSDNETYVKYLKDEVYKEDSRHECWVDYRLHCDIKKNSPYKQSRVDLFLYTSVATGSLCVILLIVLYLSQFKIIKRDEEYAIFKPEDPVPPYESLN